MVFAEMSALALFVSTWRVTFQNENEAVSPQEKSFGKNIKVAALYFYFDGGVGWGVEGDLRWWIASVLNKAQHPTALMLDTLRVRRDFFWGIFRDSHFIARFNYCYNIIHFLFVPRRFASSMLLKISFCCISIKMDSFYCKVSPLLNASLTAKVKMLFYKDFVHWLPFYTLSRKHPGMVFESRLTAN